jgi:ATP-dependent RNA helicase SUPV3L1/SUV3
MQARLFNEDNTGYDILVASDAIGMGLNLNIRRIIFHTVIKRGKNGKQWIEPSAVKQIGKDHLTLNNKYVNNIK